MRDARRRREVKSFPTGFPQRRALVAIVTAQRRAPFERQETLDEFAPIDRSRRGGIHRRRRRLVRRVAIEKRLLRIVFVDDVAPIEPFDIRQVKTLGERVESRRVGRFVEIGGPKANCWT